MPPKPNAIADPRALAPKEAALFKQVLQYYETKQFKKGLKTTADILKKYPDHGETLCMRGLFLCNTDQKTEGLDLVKKGVRLDFKSHICWHVYGLVCRAEREYDQALKCYLQASRLDKDSLNILSDLAMLQIHTRAYEGHLDTRLQLLRLFPKLKRHWLAVGVAFHLAGRLSEAEQHLRQILEFLRPPDEMEKADYEFGEVVLYLERILEEREEYGKALEALEEFGDGIKDRRAYQATRAKLLNKLQRYESAEWAWSMLLEENADSRDYILGYLTAKTKTQNPLEGESKKATLECLDELATKFPKTLLIKRMALDLSEGDDFIVRVTSYLQNGLTKGIPSLFPSLKPLLSDPSKQSSILSSVESLRTTYEKTAYDEDPMAYVWTLHLLAHLYLYHPTSQPLRALKLLEIALGHTPCLPDLYLAKARVLKHCNNPALAAEVMVQARELDHQDRFLNTKAGKYLLRAGRREDAIEVVKEFTRKDADTIEDLRDMQAIWWLKEEAAYFERKGEFDNAVKEWNRIVKIYQDIWEDQLDFHQYCLRKGTLNTYVDLVRYENDIFKVEEHFNAIRGLVRASLNVYDGADGHKTNGTNGTNGTSTEAASLPDNLLGLVKRLQKSCSKRIETWEMTFELNLRRKKYLQSLQALQEMAALVSNTEDVNLVEKAKTRLGEVQTEEAAVKDTLQKGLELVGESLLNRRVEGASLE
ncbi:N-terminal acetyltransferase A, auxiliary subunit [Atractiella rhizophila]|nr:N-terminal acetyltransferase A, auxiliary subunit [Atractiella rhizophila]